MRVALVDDNKNDLALLHEYISEQTAHSCLIDTFSSGESFLSCWQIGAYDLVVLDIFMGKCKVVFIIVYQCHSHTVKILSYT